MPRQPYYSNKNSNKEPLYIAIKNKRTPGMKNLLGIVYLLIHKEWPTFQIIGTF